MQYQISDQFNNREFFIFNCFLQILPPLLEYGSKKQRFVLKINV